jgi:two-component system, NarL family, response regulator DevR
MTEGGFPDRSDSTIRVYLVDDHEVVRRGLRELLESQSDLEVVGESGSAQQAIRRIPAIRPDVAVVDMQLPDGSGVEVCRSLRSPGLHTRALILTSFDDEEALFAAIMAGACGYFLKEVRALDLVEAVRRVAGGQSLLDPAVTAQVLDRLRRSVPVHENAPGLSEQESKVLALIADGLSNREIAEELFLAEKTIKNHVSNVLSKLGFARRTQAAVYEVERRGRS